MDKKTEPIDIPKKESNLESCSPENSRTHYTTPNDTNILHTIDFTVSKNICKSMYY